MAGPLLLHLEGEAAVGRILHQDARIETPGKSPEGRHAPADGACTIAWWAERGPCTPHQFRCNMDEATTFATDGFVRVPAFLDEAELGVLQRELARFLCEVVPRMPAAQVYREDRDDPASLKQLQQLGQHDPWFADLQTGGRLEALAAELLGEPVDPRNLQYFDKPPGTSRPTPAHQDGAYFPITPNHAVTLWLALDDVDEAQGCVRYVRGSHRRGLRPHVGSGVLGFSRGIEDEDPRDRADEVALPCRAGDLLAHHSLTLHRAEANLSTAPHRRALGLVYYGASARVDEAREAAYQGALAARLEAEGHF